MFDHVAADRRVESRVSKRQSLGATTDQGDPIGQAVLAQPLGGDHKPTPSDVDRDDGAPFRRRDRSERAASAT